MLLQWQIHNTQQALDFVHFIATDEQFMKYSSPKLCKGLCETPLDFRKSDIRNTFENPRRGKLFPALHVESSSVAPVSDAVREQ